MKFRKLLSTLLAAALVCGLACTAAFADEPADSTAETTVTTPSTSEPTEPADPVVTVEAIPAEGLGYAAIAQGLGMTGDLYAGTRSATRGEAASMVCRLLERAV